jgi:quinol monooxygenase YgiN
MPFMLKIQWDIKAGRDADFRDNQAALCKVMLEHPGVICYHVDYPSQRVSQWTEIYATDEAFAAHLANDKGKGPLAAVIDVCDKITCQCWGNPNAGCKELLAGFGTTYHETATNAFVLNPGADRDSRI